MSGIDQLQKEGMKYGNIFPGIKVKLEIGLPVFPTRYISSLEIEEQNKGLVIIVCSGFI